MTQDEPQPAWGNRLLDALPDALAQTMARQLTRVNVGRGTITTLAGEPLEHVDFPVDALMAVTATTPSGKTIEVAVIGNEGYVETDAPLESDRAHRTSLCRLPGALWRLPIADFRAALRDETFAGLIRNATRARFFVTEQAVLCNAHHTMDQRLARWLLVARDRSGRERFRVTQAELAGVLGVRRAGISLTIARLRRAGAITNERGSVMVTDYDRLLEESCECYAVMRDAIGGALT